MSEPDFKENNLNNLRDDPVIKKFLSRIPRQTAATFTNDQLAELKRVFGNRFDDSEKVHKVDIRLLISFLKRRFYFVILMGKDKRDEDQ